MLNLFYKCLYVFLLFRRVLFSLDSTFTVLTVLLILLLIEYVGSSTSSLQLDSHPVTDENKQYPFHGHLTLVTRYNFLFHNLQ